LASRATFHELVNQRFENVVLVGVDRDRATDDERSPSFIDEYGVDFVNDCVEVTALNLLFFWRGHAIVPQVVEAKFAIRSVSDIAKILLSANGWWLVVLYTANGQSQIFVKDAHPLRVTPGEVVVYRNDVNTTTGKGIQIDGQRAHKRLPFPRRHLGNSSHVQGHAADELYVKVHHLPAHWLVTNDEVVTRQSARGVFDDGEGFGQNSIE
jgi:hypothetical protein